MTSPWYCKSRESGFYRFQINKQVWKLIMTNIISISMLKKCSCIADRHVVHSLPLLTNFIKQGTHIVMYKLFTRIHFFKFCTHSSQYGFPLTVINNETEIWVVATQPYIVTWRRVRHNKQANNDNLWSGPFLLLYKTQQAMNTWEMEGLVHKGWNALCTLTQHRIDSHLQKTHLYCCNYLTIEQS